MSPSRIVKSPVGIKTFSSLLTVQIITLSFVLNSRFFNCVPFRKLFFSTFIEIKLAFCPKKFSTLNATGNISLFAILLAVSISGFIIREIPSPSLTNCIFELYSGFLTLAIVNFEPIFFAIIEEIIFSSSDSVAAIKISALSAPASSKVS